MVSVLAPNTSAYTAHHGVAERIDQVDNSWSDKSKTLIIFDWDDTLCPSSWISANRPRLSYFRTPPNDKRFVKPLDRLQNVVLQLLELATSMGKVVIITNAKESWVPMSCKNFLPKVLPTLSSIPQIYARDTWAAWEEMSTKRSTVAKSPKAELLSQVGVKLFPPHMDLQDEDPSLLWKTLAFGVELTDFYEPKQSWANVVSIGDADYERVATKNVVKWCSPLLKKKRAKTVKMFDDPTIEELILQLEKVITILPLVVKHNESIDIEIKPHDLPAFE